MPVRGCRRRPHPHPRGPGAGQEVAFAYLFGFHATGRATACSHIDVAVHLAPDAEDHWPTASRLAELLERATGLGPIEVVVLDDGPDSPGRPHP